MPLKIIELYWNLEGLLGRCVEDFIGFALATTDYRANAPIPFKRGFCAKRCSKIERICPKADGKL
jgi:hypothetical protein